MLRLHSESSKSDFQTVKLLHSYFLKFPQVILTYRVENHCFNQYFKIPMGFKAVSCSIKLTTEITILKLQEWYKLVISKCTIFSDCSSSAL